LFNHESPRRGETFVTRKITRGLARIHLGIDDTLYLGNLDAKRDWGYAKDYVEGMWMMMQHDTPDDYVLATNETHTVREFIELAAKELGFDLEWRGEGLEEEAVNAKNGKVIVRVDPRYFRPAEVDLLIGDPAKAKKAIGWEPKTSLQQLAKLMVESDLKKEKARA
jgi:GDPmannose 4,6-dehydratase